MNRLATARLVRPQAGTSSAFIDLLFANFGIEDEIVRRADRLEVLPDVFMPVASVGHLIALKALQIWQRSSAKHGNDASADEVRWNHRLRAPTRRQRRSAAQTGAGRHFMAGRLGANLGANDHRIHATPKTVRQIKRPGQSPMKPHQALPGDVMKSPP